ncbi:hypothetical protein F3F96_02890 [Mariprofundus sp. NF]|uniref:hypothetical protein n=1 Tax=Mariprofundus sp. NF TaxID=2608716 RepID=UPI0015A2A624|nr:hypothetical protein [Mariprofundus sp. NF]NWF38083.1 hypothetical protein [Mariprofundus sp. NF]
MKRVAAIFTLILTFAHTAEAEALYKCKGLGMFDTPIWTNTPCKSKSDILETRNLRVYPPVQKPEEKPAAKEHGNLTAEKAEKLIQSKKLAVGMSRKDVIRSWGKPDETDTLLTEKGKSDILIYHRGSTKSQYVLIDEQGLLTNVKSVNPNAAKTEKKQENK